MADEARSPEEQAALDAGAATIAEEQSWASKVEARLAALEDKTGLAKDNEKAAGAADKEDK